MIGVEFFFEFNLIFGLELWICLQVIRPATPTLGVKDFKLYIFKTESKKIFLNLELP